MFSNSALPAGNLQVKAPQPCSDLVQSPLLQPICQVLRTPVVHAHAKAPINIIAACMQPWNNARCLNPSPSPST